MINTILHISGPLVGGVQVCLRCGGTLTDYRNCMVEAGSDPLRGWEEGALIAVTQNASATLSSLIAPGQEGEIPTCAAKPEMLQ